MTKKPKFQSSQLRMKTLIITLLWIIDGFNSEASHSLLGLLLLIVVLNIHHLLCFVVFGLCVATYTEI